ncbi:c-type cytochrome biogenesis protein CcmI [Marinimicrobium alkaliphilum]|uniref:c-type cytochrome biogenesis protein CcmI n=1 Tax=Marinimicrobium alkaliphilum TaxID=2202654 RepID=UPI000DB91FF6|nr:c-type cytochrome biogenesis protein CcmI [Marinimicrobium alkaliphilum]
MAMLWVSAVFLSLLALAFLLWPLLVGRREQGEVTEEAEAQRQQLDTNIALYEEHLAELEANRERGSLSEEQFVQLKREMERSLLEDEHNLMKTEKSMSVRFGPWSLVVVSLAVIVGSFGLYQYLGASQDVVLKQLQQEKMQLDHDDMAAGRSPDPERTRALIRKIEQRLERRPNNTQYWFFLARNALEIGDFDRAISAYREAMARDPRSARITAELAQAMFLRNNEMTAEIAALAQQAISQEPSNTTALGLAGINAFEQQDFRSAVDYWERALSFLDPRSQSAQTLRRSVAHAREQLGEEAPEPGAGPGLAIQVRLGDQVDVSDDKWVFVYTREWQGSPMPLAITRVRVGDLPTEIILDNTMAMSTTASMTAGQELEVVARLSQQGDASPRPGDWQVTYGPVELSSQSPQVELIIDQQIP